MAYSPPYTRISALVSFFFYSVFSLYAQQRGNIFYNLTTANGLSSNRTTSVIQDRQGFYWIGTLDGLNRFDGTSCKVFQHVQSDSTSLSDNNCISLLEDDSGDIWIATLMGLNRYRKDGKFDRFFFHNPRQNFERVNWIWGMTKDSSGNIWITTCGLWQYNIHTKKWKEWLHDPSDPRSVPGGVIGSPVYDKKRNCLWMSGSTGFIQFDINSGQFYHKKNNPRQLLFFDKENYGSPIILDDNSDIWFLTHSQQKLFRYDVVNDAVQAVSIRLWRGVFNLNKDNRNRVWIHFWTGPSYIYDPSSNSLDSVFLDNYHSQSPISNNAKNLFIDRFGNYWITTWKGISIFDPDAQALKYHSIGNPANLFKEAFAITALAEQNDSLLWVGTSSGLYQYNLYQRKLTYRRQPLLKNNFGYIRSLFFQNDSILWIGGWTELLSYDIKRDKLIHYFNDVDLPQCMVMDADKNVWVGTWNNGLYKFSVSGQKLKHFLPGDQSSQSIFSDNLVCLEKNRQGNRIWIGYNGGDGFSTVSVSDQQFRHYKIRTTSQDKFPSNAINCIREDDKGNLWLGTFGRGLICFNPSNESYKTVMQSDGLKGNFIDAIFIDDSSRLWISTTNGINILDTRNNDIIQTNIDLSFAANDFLANGLARKNKHFIFFAGTRIVEVDPNAYYRAANSYEILLSSFRIFDKEGYMSANDPTVKLTYQQNFFSLDYSLLKPNPNSFTQYAYQLKGFDRDWNYVRERRTAYFTNVPPGQYEFLVKATDENGKWIYFSKPLSITIRPPFWLQWWFIGAVISLVTAGLYIFYRYRIDQLKRILAIRTKISRDLHDEVGATLSSIHIYSSVAAKAMNKDADETKNALHQINQNTRQVMENMSDIVWAISADYGNETTLAAKLKNYGYDLLTPLNIKCVYHIDKEVEKKLVNMEGRKNILLIAKEAINNIGKYSQATEALIRLEIKGRDLELEITDNGNGISSQQKHTGYGINNMRQRAEAMNGTFQINSEIHKGTTIYCSIPLPNISSH